MTMKIFCRCLFKETKRHTEVRSKLLCSLNIPAVNGGGAEKWEYQRPGRGRRHVNKSCGSQYGSQSVLSLLVSVETAGKTFLAGHFHFLLNQTE